MKWLKSFKTKPKRVFVVHGDDQVCEEFKEYIKKEHGYNAVAPYSGTIYDLKTNLVIVEGERIPVKKKVSKADTLFERLEKAGRRLMDVIRRSKGISNKDLRKFTDQINELSNKWDNKQ